MPAFLSLTHDAARKTNVAARAAGADTAGFRDRERGGPSALRGPDAQLQPCVPHPSYKGAGPENPVRESSPPTRCDPQVVAATAVHSYEHRHLRGIIIATFSLNMIFI
jgi:hypothetical protein